MTETLMTSRVEYVNEYPYVRYSEDGEYWTACPRCAGTGSYSFDGYSSECYLCRGTKSVSCVGDREAVEKHSAKRAKARAAREAKKEREYRAMAAEAEARIATFVAAEPEVAAFLRPIWEAENVTNQFLDSLAGQVFNYGSKSKNTLSEKQIEAIKRIIAAEAAKPKTEYLAEEKKRVEFEGEIVHRNSIDGDFGVSIFLIIKVSESVTVKTWTSAGWAFGSQIEKGYKGKFKGTVKVNAPSARGENVSVLTRLATVE
jgi:hypothetical protein